MAGGQSRGLRHITPNFPMRCQSTLGILELFSLLVLAHPPGRSHAACVLVGTPAATERLEGPVDKICQRWLEHAGLREQHSQVRGSEQISLRLASPRAASPPPVRTELSFHATAGASEAILRERSTLRLWGTTLSLKFARARIPKRQQTAHCVVFRGVCACRSPTKRTGRR